MLALARLEAVLLLRTRTFVAAATLILALAGLVGWQGGEFARSQADAIDTATALERATDAEALARARQIAAGEIDPPWWRNPLNVQNWSYAMVRHVALPPKPLAGVAVADADLQPFLFRISPHPPDRWSNRASELTPSMAALGGFDLVELILILTPLLVLVAFADVIRDRDGSDRQRLGIVQSASERAVLLARLWPRALVVLALVLGAALVGIGATLPPLGVETVTGSLAILAVFVAHAAVWAVAAAAIILTLRRAVVTGTAYLCLWFILGVTAPILAEAGARIMAPPPSAVGAFAEEREAIVAARMQEEALVRAYAASDPAAREMLLEALDRGTLLITPTNLLVQREVDRRLAGTRAARRTAREAFESWLRTTISASPTLLARSAIHEVAGRGQRRRAHFDAAVQAYHADLQAAFGPLLMRRAELPDVLLPAPFVFQEGDEQSSQR